MFTPRAPETLISIRRIPKWLRNSRKESIRQGVPALMEVISISMREGSSVTDAVRSSSSRNANCPKALIEEMSSVGLLIDAGSSIDDSLKAVALRVDMPEFDMLVSSCSEREGRSRQEVMISLEIVSKRLRERNNTLGMMHTTEQNAVMAGGIIGCGPFLALLLTNIIFPEQIAVMSHGVVSQVMLALAFAFVLSGVAWICSLGRTKPGQTQDEVNYITATLNHRMIAPVVFCIIPALFLVGFAPLVANI